MRTQLEDERIKGVICSENLYPPITLSYKEIECSDTLANLELEEGAQLKVKCKKMCSLYSGLPLFGFKIYHAKSSICFAAQ